MRSFNKIKEQITVNNHKVLAYSNVHTPIATPSQGYLYIIAGTHGDEPESTYVLKKLIEQDYFHQLSYPLIFIPELNPDGLILNSRVNGNQVDLNRNMPTSDWSIACSEPRYFPGLAPASEIETKFLLDLFTSHKPCFIISLHSWKPLLNHSNNSLALAVAKLIAKYNHYPVTDHIGYTTTGSLGSYVAERLDCGILTYELPVIEEGKDLSLEDIWDENKAGLKAVLEYLGSTLATYVE